MRCGPFGAIIFGLALLIQLLAPALASQGSMGAVNGHMPFCLDSGVNDDADGSNSGSVPPHHEHCGLCQVVCAATGLLGIVSVAIVLAPPAERLVALGTHEPERKARFGSDQHKVPRGPPFLA